MVEILGNHLMRFMIAMSDHKEYERHQRKYKGARYEVWEISDDLFKDMCDITEEMFIDLAGENAWWRYAEGSVLDAPDTKVYVNGLEMLGWTDGTWDDEDEEDEYEIHSSSLTSYLCDVVGASQPKNVCALAMDLAKYNNMTMGELFKKYEPLHRV